MSTLEAGLRSAAASICGVCGQTLTEADVERQPVDVDGARWVCPVCGAHRVPLPD
ncbi:hypothetical protein GIY23_15315 [Allosaccharopolyspora coralli]|uniref:Uncharacterized protein n=1 Tax=Allosaccharopolyspora coralli TaxID=2665642 RepID=A0A5Q3Q7Q3_9PSEU|nr:hypothetical protein [Allosaccharopolyspora coralli]QGK70701.1 hypothetical protein GIY23_15315 [Allosaccharopolyspora coralli]